MGKLVKFCSTCDEGFAERFAFCPVCGATLQAFEMNPVEAGTAEPGDSPTTAPAIEEFYSAPETVADVKAADMIDEPAEVNEPEEEDVPPTVAVPAAAAAGVFTASAMNADEPRMKVTPEALDQGYYITVIEEKNVKQRNVLLLSAALLCVAFASIMLVRSIMAYDIDIAAIDSDKLFSAVIVDEPMATEPEEEQKKDDDEDGGGGGGGKEEPDPVNQGDLPDQSKTPTRPPDPTVPRLENPSLMLMPPQTEGTKKFPKIYGQWGDPNSKYAGLSNGPGTGGGMGTGVGTGAGSGRGTGTGSGSGSGYGSGSGDGDGDGSGSGSGGGPPPTTRSAVTTPLQILSKPKATYTDAARTNNVQGSVRLKITLLASGQVGSITPVTRLPHGLTEQAIAAARQIRFKPKMINGVAQSVVVTFDYGFNIY
jgi:TonB family protein